MIAGNDLAGIQQEPLSSAVLPFMFFVSSMYGEGDSSDLPSAIKKLLSDHPVYILYMVLEVAFAACYIFIGISALFAFIWDSDYVGSWELLGFNLFLSYLGLISNICPILGMTMSAAVLIFYWHILLLPGFLPMDTYSTSLYSSCVLIVKIFLMATTIPVFFFISIVSNAYSYVSVSVGGHDSTITDYLLFVGCLVSCYYINENVHGVVFSASTLDDNSKETSNSSTTSAANLIISTSLVVANLYDLILFLKMVVRSGKVLVNVRGDSRSLRSLNEEGRQSQSVEVEVGHTFSSSNIIPYQAVRYGMLDQLSV